MLSISSIRLWTAPLRQGRNRVQVKKKKEEKKGGGAVESNVLSVLPQRHDAPCETYKKQL